jgi:surface antigen
VALGKLPFKLPWMKETGSWQLMQSKALEYGAPGGTTPWNNPASQHHGEIMVGKPYPQGNLYCRAYTHTI